MSDIVNTAIFSELKTLRVETLVLKTVCGLIIANICVKEDNPNKKMFELTSEMRAVVDSLVRNSDPSSYNKEFSDSIDAICSLSENTLSDLLRRG